MGSEMCIRDSSAGTPTSVYAIDVDGDGDPDVLSSSKTDVTVAWYENDGIQSFTGRIISSTASDVRGVHAFDLDSDGDIDVLSASSSDDTGAWSSNVDLDGSRSVSGSENQSTHRTLIPQVRERLRHTSADFVAGANVSAEPSPNAAAEPGPDAATDGAMHERRLF